MSESTAGPTVVELARWYAALCRGLEAARACQFDDARELDREQALSHAIGAIERLIELTPTATPEGTVVQLMLASAHCETIQVADDPVSTGALRRARRLLLTAIETMGERHDIDLTDMGGRELLPNRSPDGPVSSGSPCNGLNRSDQRAMPVAQRGRP